jgi:hypothetical protein
MDPGLMRGNSTSMRHDRAWLKVRDYAFICHAEKDKPRINRLRLLPGVTDNNDVSVNVVIDRDAGIDLGNRPFSVYSFRGGRPWEPQMMSYAHGAGCVLILWSHNMRERVLAEPQGGYIGQEILTGLRCRSAPPIRSLILYLCAQFSSFDFRAGIDVGRAVRVADKTHLITAQLGKAAQPPRAHFYKEALRRHRRTEAG